MNADTDLLDLDDFTTQFESGELDHLIKKTKPKKSTKKEKPVKRLEDIQPSSVVPLVDRISCRKCGETVEFLKGYGLKTVYKNHNSIKAVSKINIKQFNALVKQNLFNEALVNEQSFENCCKCVTHKWWIDD